MVKTLLKTRELKTVLLNYENRINMSQNAIGYRTSELSSLINAIESFKPDIKLIYNDIGISGSAIKSANGNSLQMKLIDVQSCTWEINTNLNDGNILFTIRKTSSLSWGGSDFPEGQAIFRGDEILKYWKLQDHF